MRLYNKYTHEFATLVSQSDTHYAVKYDGEDQIYTAPNWYFEVVNYDD